MGDKPAPIPDDPPGGAIAGPPPGIYANDDEYYKDINAGFPKMKECIAKKRQEAGNADDDPSHSGVV